MNIIMTMRSSSFWSGKVYPDIRMDHPSDGIKVEHPFIASKNLTDNRP